MKNLQTHRARLSEAASIPDRALRALSVAAVIGDALARAGAMPVLVGGGAVEIYSRSAYTTRDLDFVVGPIDRVTKPMQLLGFEKEGRHWIESRLGIAVEFPGTVLGPAESIEIEVHGMQLHVIAVEDLIVDRLASWKHWHWNPDGAAAAILLALHEDLDSERLEKRAQQEDVLDALESIRAAALEQAELSDELLTQLRERLTR
ncbi:MAG: hypothetical protein GKS06_20610 [Acidobacteria bacterium]|nr:hypothetical protein [Acidobacteriota bacterium]